MTNGLSGLFICAALVAAPGCSSSTAGTPDAGETAPDASAEDARIVEAGPSADSEPDPFSEAGLASDSADGGTDAFEAAAMPTCGPAPARYTILTGVDKGLVRDNVTELVWMSGSVGGGEPPQHQSTAATYCSGRGMRLPTKDEALALAAAYASCAFGQWSTWTSTTAPAAGDAWVVDYLGDSSPQVAGNFPSAVLCVRGATG